MTASLKHPGEPDDNTATGPPGPDSTSGVSMEASRADAPSLAALQASLRETFGADVAARLPRLQALLDGKPGDLEDVRRDAHTLASSACIVAEPEIAQLAQQVELDVTGGPLAALVDALRGFAP